LSLSRSDADGGGFSSNRPIRGSIWGREEAAASAAAVTLATARSVDSHMQRVQQQQAQTLASKVAIVETAAQAWAAAGSEEAAETIRSLLWLLVPSLRSPLPGGDDVV
jgi:hypothetical protein